MSLPRCRPYTLAAASGDLEAFQEMIKAQAGDAARFFHEKNHEIMGRIWEQTYIWMMGDDYS